MPAPTQPAPSAPPNPTPVTIVSAAPAAAKPAPSAPAAPPTDAKKPDEALAAPEVPKKPEPGAAGLAELQRKENAFRLDKKKHDDDMKAWQAEKAERATKEAQWKDDPLALLEAHGHTIDAVIDYAASGGANSPEGKIRALESKFERREREAKEAAEKATKDQQAAIEAQRVAEVKRFIHVQVDKLSKDDRFELCSKATERGANIPLEVELRIRKAWDGEPVLDEYGRDTGERTGGGVDLSIEQALDAIENELDTYGLSLASSKKLKAKLAPAPSDGTKPNETNQQPTRQDEPAPTASTRRAITIKNRQQAVAPIRTRAREDGRAPPSEVSRQVADNFARLFAKK